MDLFLKGFYDVFQRIFQIPDLYMIGKLAGAVCIAILLFLIVRFIVFKFF